ncbi:hypothetical protein ACFT9M_25480 [Micromonospora purpureochromogenes]|uniref:hypothetical protein n=1 Tax=Micromonospora purpureochromogenes TaxID=47872 RepID=UPI003644DE2C
MLASETPKITDWMQAWGSVAGLVMSTIAVVLTGLLFRHEIRVRREEQRDTEAALARLVIAEFWYKETTELDDGGRQRGDLKILDFRIRNLNNAPILNVTLGVQDVVTNRVYIAHDLKSVIVSQAEMGVVFNPPLPLNEDADVDHLLPVIRFTDANGLRWIRLGTASPERDLSKGLGRLGALIRPRARPAPTTEHPDRRGGAPRPGG